MKNYFVVLTLFLLCLSIPSDAGVNDGQPVNAAITNAAFLNKNQNDTDPFVITLSNSAGTSGTTINNVQKQLNSTSSFLGSSVNQGLSYLPTWATTNRGTSGDSVFTRVEAIDTAFDGSSGHTHDGTTGNGPQLSFSTATTGTVGISRGGTGQTTATAAFNALSPMTTLGDLIYEDSTPSGVRLAGNTTSTRMFLRQTGTGSVSAAPAWDTLLDADLPLTNAHILVGNASNLAADVAMSGDVTITNAGVTAIGSNKVANSQLAQMAAHTFKGNNTGSTANASDLTDTQATAELNAFVGDSGSGGTKGLVPAPASGDAAAGKFLKADGTFAVPSGSSTSTDQSYELSNCGISATISSNTVVLNLKQADGSTDPSTGTSACTVGFRSATATAGGYQTVNFTAANSITVGTTASLGHTSMSGANIYAYLIQDTTSEICVSNSPYLDDGILHSATATPATTGGTLYCTNSHTSRPTRLIGVVQATWSNPNWSSITKVAMVPFRRYDEDTIFAIYNWQGSHTYSGAETMRFDTKEQDNLNAFSTSTFTFTNQIPSFCTAGIDSEFNALDGVTDAYLEVTVCGSSQQCYSARNASNSASSAAGYCVWSRQCSVGDTILATAGGDASYTLDNNGQRTKIWIRCSPYPQ